jgi:hypothetical protein
MFDLHRRPDDIWTQETIPPSGAQGMFWFLDDNQIVSLPFEEVFAERSLTAWNDVNPIAWMQTPEGFQPRDAYTLFSLTVKKIVHLCEAKANEFRTQYTESPNYQAGSVDTARDIVQILCAVLPPFPSYF